MQRIKINIVKKPKKGKRVWFKWSDGTVITGLFVEWHCTSASNSIILENHWCSQWGVDQSVAEQKQYQYPIGTVLFADEQSLILEIVHNFADDTKKRKKILEEFIKKIKSEDEIRYLIQLDKILLTTILED